MFLFCKKEWNSNIAEDWYFGLIEAIKLAGGCAPRPPLTFKSKCLHQQIRVAMVAVYIGRAVAILVPVCCAASVIRTHPWCCGAYKPLLRHHLPTQTRKLFSYAFLR